jgi:hypothetical protein
MSDQIKPTVRPTDEGGPGTGSALGTLLAVMLLLAAVVGGAWYINSNDVNQASVNQTESSSTGASTGEAGTSSSSTTAPPAVKEPAVPDKTPASEPKQP